MCFGFRFVCSNAILKLCAAYIIFGYAMYSILGELEWLKRYRHRFLTKQKARNYSIYLRCITTGDYLTNDGKLVDYFNSIYNDDQVCVEAHVARKIPNLSKKVLERDALVANLEHAMNVKEDTGGVVPPMHSTKLCGGEKVDSIQTYTKELKTLNAEIKVAMETLESNHNGNKDSNEATSHEKEETNDAVVASPPLAEETTDAEPGKSFLGLLSGQADGAKLTAAFVSFRSLRAANAAIQIDHSEQPHAMEVFEAPDPDGKNHKMRIVV
jgi:hypothetical protein